MRYEYFEDDNQMMGMGMQHPQTANMYVPKTENGAWGFIVALIVLVWIIAGIFAFIMSILCFGSSGTIGQQVVGLLIAIFFGPFYWLYYIAVKSYCRSSISAPKKKRYS